MKKVIFSDIYMTHNEYETPREGLQELSDTERKDIVNIYGKTWTIVSLDNLKIYDIVLNVEDTEKIKREITELRENKIQKEKEIAEEKRKFKVALLPGAWA